MFDGAQSQFRLWVCGVVITDNDMPFCTINVHDVIRVKPSCLRQQLQQCQSQLLSMLSVLHEHVPANAHGIKLHSCNICLLIDSKEMYLSA